MNSIKFYLLLSVVRLQVFFSRTVRANDLLKLACDDDLHYNTRHQALNCLQLDILGPCITLNVLKTIANIVRQEPSSSSIVVSAVSVMNTSLRSSTLDTIEASGIDVGRRSVAATLSVVVTFAAVIIRRPKRSCCAAGDCRLRRCQSARRIHPIKYNLIQQLCLFLAQISMLIAGCAQ